MVAWRRSSLGVSVHFGRALPARACSAAAGPSSLVNQHKSLCASGTLRADERQATALIRLQDLRLELRDHWSAMRVYSEELIKWHIEVRAIRERQRAAEEERRRLAARPLWQRLWAQISPWPQALPPPVEATPQRPQPGAEAPALETLIQTRAPTPDCLDQAGGCSGGGRGCSSGGGGCSTEGGSSQVTSGCSSSSDTQAADCGGGGGGGGGGCSTQGGGCSQRANGAAEVSAAARASVTAIVAPPSDGPLSDEEKRHPFWRSGLGANAVRIAPWPLDDATHRGHPPVRVVSGTSRG